MGIVQMSSTRKYWESDACYILLADVMPCNHFAFLFILSVNLFLYCTDILCHFPSTHIHQVFHKNVWNFCFSLGHSLTLKGFISENVNLHNIMQHYILMLCTMHTGSQRT